MGLFDNSTTLEDNSPLEDGQEIEERADDFEETEDFDNETTSEEDYEEEDLDDEDSSTDDSEEQESKVEKNFDIKKAYDELRKDYTRKTQELAEMKRRNTPPSGQEDGEKPDFWEGFWENGEGAIERKAQEIAWNMVAPLYEQKIANEYAENISSFTEEYPQLETEDGYKAYLENLYNIAHELGNPNLVNNPNKRLIDMAVRETFGDSKAKLYEKAKAKGKQEVLDNMRAKKGLSASNSKQQQQTTKTIEEEIADSIVGSGRRNGIFG